MKPKILHFKEISSTQDKAKELAKKGISSAIVVANLQSKGRGRLGRRWHSGNGGLWMSILLKPKDGKNTQYLTFIASIAVAESIKKIAELDAKIKWPNDIHMNGKKLCGILTEGVFGNESFLVVGIGLNVNQKRFADDIKKTATSLCILCNKAFDKKIFLEDISRRFFSMHEKFFISKKFEIILEKWKKNSDTIGKDAIVSSKKGEFKGRVVGIGRDCSLLLKDGKNKTTRILEGDVSVRYEQLR